MGSTLGNRSRFGAFVAPFKLRVLRACTIYGWHEAGELVTVHCPRRAVVLIKQGRVEVCDVGTAERLQPFTQPSVKAAQRALAAARAERRAAAEGRTGGAAAPPGGIPQAKFPG